MAVQTTYSENIEAARAGLIAGSDFDVETGIVEDAAGIAAGLAVAQGTLSDKGVIRGGTTTTFRGVSVRDVTLGAEVDTTPQYGNIGVLTRGTIWVRTSSAAVANAPVYFTAADGLFTDESGGNVLVKGARFVTGAAQNGFALIKLSGAFRGVDM
jgi:hypothetical protein